MSPYITHHIHDSTIQLTCGAWGFLLCSYIAKHHPVYCSHFVIMLSSLTSSLLFSPSFCSSFHILFHCALMVIEFISSILTMSVKKLSIKSKLNIAACVIKSPDTSYYNG